MPIKGLEKEMENLVCIGIYGRNDKDTLLYKEIVKANGKKTLKKAKGSLERHLTFTKKMRYENEYLIHGNIHNICATGAFLVEVASVLEEFNSVATLTVVLFDNTNSNTDCETGPTTVLEKKIQRNVQTIVCSLPQTELPFRTLFRWYYKELDIIHRFTR